MLGGEKTKELVAIIKRDRARESCFTMMYPYVTLNDGTEVLTAAMAEFSLGRLFARSTDKTRLVITQRSNGNVVFDIPIVDYFCMVKGHYSQPMTDQEYLDRQDDYSIVVFLEHKEGPEGYYIAAVIYINGWQIVLSNPDIY